jgi:pimeloyl-ACP methyl ester carboxylesterase
LLGEFELSEADQTVLRDQIVRERMRTSLREALASGVWGWVDDDLAFVKPWGFEVQEIQVPVQVRYGAGDVLVPAGHGEWLARHVPNANVIVDHEAGHLSTPDEHLERLRSLVSGRRS